MAYTVKKLAKLSGVTERTLRWYNKVGLLKPAYYSSSGYRQYEEEQLLLLQQILFFRELDFSLDEIRRIITGSDFDKINALSVHKKALRRRLERTEDLIKTIDKTLLHLRGKIIMEDKEIYQGFQQWSKGKGSESFILGYCENPDELENEAEKIVLKSVKKQEGKDRDQAWWENLEKSYKEIYGAIAECVEKGRKPTSDEVQKLIEKHHTFVEQFHDCTKEVYKAFAKLYREKPDYRQQLDPLHPDLANFMAKAMVVFADKNLK